MMTKRAVQKNLLKVSAFIMGFFMAGLAAPCQDTVRVTPGMIKTAYLKPRTDRYLVYFKNGEDSTRIRYQLWTRKIEQVDYNGKRRIAVSQSWEDNDTVFHKAYSVCDEKTFAPLFHETWWRKRGSLKFDFLQRTATYLDTLMTDNESSPGKRNMYNAFRKSLDQYVLNWHLDLEVFSLLPYKENTTFLINFYDPGFPEPRYEAYTVVGSSKLKGYGSKELDCWLLRYGSGADTETFWIEETTHEVLKLEEQSRGRFRYKIKLAFSV
jgi:hypothetical protein